MGLLQLEETYFSEFGMWTEEHLLNQLIPSPLRSGYNVSKAVLGGDNAEGMLCFSSQGPCNRIHRRPPGKHYQWERISTSPSTHPSCLQIVRHPWTRMLMLHLRLYQHEYLDVEVEVDVRSSHHHRYHRHHNYLPGWDLFAQTWVVWLLLMHYLCQHTSSLTPLCHPQLLTFQCAIAIGWAWPSYEALD